MRQTRTDAIVLDTTNVFDADRSLLIFTRELGKIRARARGVRKPTSRLAGHLLPFLPTRLELVHSGENYLVVQAHSQAESDNLVGFAAYNFMQVAETIAEALNYLMVEHSPHPDIYNALVYTLSQIRLNSQKGDDITFSWLIAAEFLTKCASALGFKPEVENCLVCGDKLTEAPLAWSSQLGGAFLQTHINQLEPGTSYFNLEYPRTVLVLRQFLQPRFVAGSLQAPSPMVREVVKVILDFVQYQTGRPLKSLLTVG